MGKRPSLIAVPTDLDHMSSKLPYPTNVIIVWSYITLIKQAALTFYLL